MSQWAIVAALVGGFLFFCGLVASAAVRSSRLVAFGGAGLIVAGLALAGFAFRDFWQLGWVVAYLCVCALGGGVGAAELVSRYKDNPQRAITTLPAGFYVFLNAVGSIGALYLMSVFAEKLGLPKELDKWDAGSLVMAVLAAGFSALLFFRSSLFKFRVGDADLAVGPSIVLDSLLAAADRAVDRVMARPRAAFVHSLMGDLSFDKAAAILPAHCLALMQNVSAAEAERIAGVVNELRANKEMPDKIKSLNLGLALLTVVGEEVLKTAVDGLAADLQDSTAVLMRNAAAVMAPVSFERARTMLPDYCLDLWPKPIQNDLIDKFKTGTTALAALSDVPEDYKALILGIRLGKLTDGATLRKAVNDLGDSIRKQAQAEPAQSAGPQAG